MLRQLPPCRSMWAALLVHLTQAQQNISHLAFIALVTTIYEHCTAFLSDNPYHVPSERHRKGHGAWTCLHQHRHWVFIDSGHVFPRRYSALVDFAYRSSCGAAFSVSFSGALTGAKHHASCARIYFFFSPGEFFPGVGWLTARFSELWLPSLSACLRQKGH